ncbi:hypothetical protein BKA62DRAFT_766207 [Auriculariales sp. MPI-PUGE-AT-0066]|nr:hypothetical protein BKA62DRAFT_766207 [Auriculariales sp. MPI-PUGE-AT-0066]
MTYPSLMLLSQSHALALPRSDNASEIDKGQYWRERPQKPISAADPPPRELLASESSGTIRSITPRPHEQTISWVSDQQRRPFEQWNWISTRIAIPMIWGGLVWWGGCVMCLRTHCHTFHRRLLQAGTSPGTSHISHLTHSRSFSSPAAHPHFKFVAPPSSRGTSTQAVAELAIQPPSESQSPASLNPTPTAAATPGHLPLSAATPLWPRFGFASGVPDDSAESHIRPPPMPQRTTGGGQSISPHASARSQVLVTDGRRLQTAEDAVTA